jgi:hypothetical protein
VARALPVPREPVFPGREPLISPVLRMGSRGVFEFHTFWPTQSKADHFRRDKTLPNARSLLNLSPAAGRFRAETR